MAGAVFGFVADDGAFETPGAEATPAGDGHAVDDVFFDFVGGLELGAEGFEDAGEALGGFVGQDDGAGEEAVFGGIAGGVGFALGGNGAVGFGSVLAGGFWPRLKSRVLRGWVRFFVFRSPG